MRVKLSHAFIAFAGVLIVFWYWFIGTPRYSLYALNRAIEQHDLVGFNRYVEVESVSSHYADDIWEDAILKMREKTPNSGSVETILSTMESTTKEQQIGTIKKQFDQTIEDPNEAAWLGLKIQTIKQHGKIATAVLVNGHGSTFRSGIKVLRLQMREGSDRRWKVIAVPTLSEMAGVANSEDQLSQSGDGLPRLRWIRSSKSQPGIPDAVS